MPSCIVHSCNSYWKRKEPGLSLHVFPRDRARIMLWLQTKQFENNLEDMNQRVYEGEINDPEVAIAIDEFESLPQSRVWEEKTKEEDYVSEKKFIIFESCLDWLLKFVPCLHPNCKAEIVGIKKNLKGSSAARDITRIFGFVWRLSPWQEGPIALHTLPFVYLLLHVSVGVEEVAGRLNICYSAALVLKLYLSTAKCISQVLYTHQKTKKAKVWQDGVLKFSAGASQATLYSDKGQRLESVYIKTGKVCPGDDLESDRYLITVEAEGTSSQAPKTLTESKEISTFNRSGLKPVGLRPPAGLKRRFTDFQCPREVPKKLCEEIQEYRKAPPSPQISPGFSSLPSRFITTSPLFAVPYVKKTDAIESSDRLAKRSFASETGSCVSWREAHEKSLFSNCTGTGGQSCGGENILRVNVLGDGSSAQQKRQSTAQILPLIKSQPKSEGSLNNVTDQHTGKSVNTNDDCLRPTSTDLTNIHVPERKTYCQEQPLVKPLPVKSRWDIYLDPLPASNTSFDGNDTFELESSPDKILDKIPSSFQNTDRDDESKRKSTCNVEDEKPHVAKPPNTKVYNAELHSHSRKSGLDHIEYPHPKPCFPPIQSELEIEDLPQENDGQNGSFSEVTFNLMDSFDFTELDDEGSDVDSSIPAAHSEVMDLNVDSNVSERKFLHKGSEMNADTAVRKEECNTNCTSPILTEVFGNTVTQNPAEHTAFTTMAKSNTCDKQPEADEHMQQTLLSSGESQEIKGEECISSPQPIFKSTEASQLECFPSDDDDLFECITDNASAQLSALEKPIEEVYCNETPRLPDSGSSISLLKSLTQPCNAFESLNAVKLESSSTPERRACEAEIFAQIGPQEETKPTGSGFNLLPKSTESKFNSLDPPEKEGTVFKDALPTLREPVKSVCLNEVLDVPTLKESTVTTGMIEDYNSTNSNSLPISPHLNSQITALDNKYFQYDGLSAPHDDNTSSSIPCVLPQWTAGSQESDCDWEYSQLTLLNKEISPVKQNLGWLDRPFFLRPRQSVTVESSDELNDGPSLCEQQGRDSVPLWPPKNTSISTNTHSSKWLKYKDVSDSTNVDDEEKRDFCAQSVFRNLQRVQEIQEEDDLMPNLTPPHLKDNFYSQKDAGSRLEQITKHFNSARSSLHSLTSLTWMGYGSGRVHYFAHGQCGQTSSHRVGLVGHHTAHSVAKKVVVDAASKKTMAGLQDDIVKPPPPGLHKYKGSDPSMQEAFLFGNDPGHHASENLPAEEKCLVLQIVLPCDLLFPPKNIVLSSSVPKRKVNIPAMFNSSAHYKQVFCACLAEHLNIIMFELAQRLHKAFSRVDMSFYTSSVADEANRKGSATPLCLHQQPAKLVMVKKEGCNKGRFFYTCDAPKASQCKYFKWLDEVKGADMIKGQSESRLIMGDMKSLSKYVRCQNINLYEESQLIIRKISGYPKQHFGKFSKMVSGDAEFSGESKMKLYLKLSRKEGSSAYSKDDLWVVSKTLDFDTIDTFIACSSFYGPTSNNDIEIVPLKGYCPSNWPANMVVHALLVYNASTELTCLRNIQEHFNPSTLPLMPHLLTMSSDFEQPRKISKGSFKPPAITAKVSTKCEIPDYDFVMNLAEDTISKFCLNVDQSTALMKIAHMMCCSSGPKKKQVPPIAIIHGVFGAGKSYLLAVVVLFLVQLFESFDPCEETGSFHWKLLISSSTNVAVDRVLLGLLELGFEQFIRVGSIRKIAKPILPHSLHAGSENESEQLRELLALLKEDLSPGEKAYVRKSIEQHKLGTNKTLLGQVRVVGATCAACPFACMSNLKFSVVILDECSQMTEPASLLPIARFKCEKLILVGDPKQLSPTIQGSEAAHEYGLEQTLFNRLCLMGHQALMLRTQYRCHPVISAVVNNLFYEGYLLNGVSQEDRIPLLDWLPTLCFYNACGTEQVEGNNSFHNVEEASFTVKLIQSLIASGIEGSMIGVITLYKSQMSKVCSLLASASQCDPAQMRVVQVSTVDAFQGAEKEIIILSCVRTRQVGFIDSEKRMTVALTRGKRHLLIVGNLACLRRNKLWEQVVHHCESQNNGLKHVSQWDEKLNNILKLYQEQKEQQSNSERKPPKER
ncbi:5'-3' DNA helicase ZGRF1 [Gastrophryne carolinensis]